MNVLVLDEYVLLLDEYGVQNLFFKVLVLLLKRIPPCAIQYAVNITCLSKVYLRIYSQTQIDIVI